MRVGLVIYGNLQIRTGGYLYDRRLAQHMTEHGDDVDVVSLPWRNYGRHLCDNASVSLAHRLDSARYDLIVQDELNHPSLVLTNRRLRNRHRCAVVSIVHCLRADEHGGSPLRSLYAAAERRYLTGVDAAVFCSEATRAAAERVAHQPLRGLVAHPGCDHLGPPADDATVASKARERGPLQVLSVANVLPNKGLHVLVDALARLPLQDWRLTVVGSLTMDPAYVERVCHAIDLAGLRPNVRLVGAVDNAEVHDHLSESHVLAVPSTYEALGIAYLEGMSLGLPVIATAAGGAREIVEHGREGFLVAPGDVDALSRHLGLLAGDRDLLREMGLAARRRAAGHPTWAQSLESVREFLGRVVRDHRREAGEEAS